MERVKKWAFYLLVFIVFEFVCAIHEYGHLRELQKRGVAVKEFSLGIGPALCQYETDSSLTLSFRIFPLMSYVSPDKEAALMFDKQGTFWNKIIVHMAGVRDNLLSALAMILYLQFLGWRKGNLSSKEFAKKVMITPLKVPLRFVAFLIGCVTSRQVNIASRFLLSTGGINPPKLIRAFIFWNLMFGFLNLTPIPPLDGSKGMEVILLATGVNNYLPSIPGFVVALLFGLYIVSANEQDLRLLEVDKDRIELQRRDMD